MTFEYDPKPWSEMTNAEKKAQSAKLREQMRTTPRNPDSSTADMMALLYLDPVGGPH
jgi:hypothetical protein